jgi:hypothetical protein
MNDEPSASTAHATDRTRYATTIEQGRIAHARERFSVRAIREDVEQVTLQYPFRRR